MTNQQQQNFFEGVDFIREYGMLSIVIDLLMAIFFGVIIVVVYCSVEWVIGLSYPAYSWFLMFHYDGWNAYLIAEEMAVEAEAKAKAKCIDK